VFGDRIILKDVFPLLITPLDFYMWGAMKVAINKYSPHILLELNEAITGFFRNIPPIELSYVFRKNLSCVDACLPAHGVHFQHLCNLSKSENVFVLMYILYKI
jgi:hypothetical protein